MADALGSTRVRTRQAVRLISFVLLCLAVLITLGGITINASWFAPLGPYNLFLASLPTITDDHLTRVAAVITGLTALGFAASDSEPKGEKMTQKYDRALRRRDRVKYFTHVGAILVAVYAAYIALGGTLTGI